jgi:hypothetical protein
MFEQADIAHHDATLHAQLRLFCHLMLGSAEAADCTMQQIYRRALDNNDEQENWPSDRIRLFRIAAEFCGVSPAVRTSVNAGPGEKFLAFLGRSAPALERRTPP